MNFTSDQIFDILKLVILGFGGFSLTLLALHLVTLRMIYHAFPLTPDMRKKIHDGVVTIDEIVNLVEKVTNPDPLPEEIGKLG